MAAQVFKIAVVGLVWEVFWIGNTKYNKCVKINNN
jgi:hypothetical protein